MTDIDDLGDLIRQWRHNSTTPTPRPEVLASALWHAGYRRMVADDAMIQRDQEDT